MLILQLCHHFTEGYGGKICTRGRLWRTPSMRMMQSLQASQMRGMA